MKNLIFSKNYSFLQIINPNIMLITPLLGSLGTILSLCLQLSPSPAIYKGLKEGIIKSLTTTYFIMGIVQSTFWGGYGYNIRDPFVFGVNMVGIALFTIYLNIMFYINNQKKNYIMINGPLVILFIISMTILGERLNLYLAVIVACFWQSATVPTMRLALAKKDCSFVNILLCYISFANFITWIIYGILIESYLMSFQNTVSASFMAMNIYIYFWATGVIKNDDDCGINLLRKLLRVDNSDNFYNGEDFEGGKNIGLINKGIESEMKITDRN